jgi:Flp pilus assembly pilin Flp
MKKLLSCLNCQSGATAIEYALIASFISVVIFGAIKIIGEQTTNSFNNVSNNLR